MLDPPCQDWNLYRQLTDPHEIAWQRSLTPAQKYYIYKDLHRIVMASKGPGDWAKLDELVWREKVARRLVEVSAYRKLDELRHERSATNHAG